MTNSHLPAFQWLFSIRKWNYFDRRLPTDIYRDSANIGSVNIACVMMSSCK